MPSLAGIDCVGYVRVSTDRQAGEAQTSLADQQTAIEGLAARRSLTVGAWYRDEGASGATVAKRPALLALLADCEAAPRKLARPGYVLVLNDSRWGRFPNPDQGAALRYRFEESGWLVRLVESDDSEDITFRHVMRAIGGAQASQYRRTVQQNAKRGSRGTAAQGFWATRAPFGYQRRVVFPPGRERVLLAHQRKAPDEKVALWPSPEAPVVTELFARYASGTESLASCVAWLRETTPERRWTRAAVRFTLTNPAYCGDVVSGRVPGDKDERAKTPVRPDAEWVVMRDAHPALVARDLFARVQDVLARNGKWTRRVRTSWVVSGLVRCPCGRPMVSGGSGRGGESYRCVSKAGTVADRCAFPGAVKKEWLERAVIDTVAAFVGAPRQRARLLSHLDAVIAESHAAPALHASTIDRTIATTTATRDRLVAAVADGTLTGTEARDRLSTVRRELARLESQRASLTLDGLSDRAAGAERDRVAALALDFPRAAAALHGPALRELLRPWIAGADFDPRTRVLTLAVRYIPSLSHGDSEQMPCHPTQKAPRTAVRRVVVGAPQAGVR